MSLLRKVIARLGGQRGGIDVNVGAASAVVLAVVAVAVAVVVVPSVTGGGSSSTANLWIDSTGGTCTRQSSAGAYNDAGACSSAQAALSAASCGDRVRYVDGTYAVQNVTTSSLSCTTGTRVVFSPDNDVANTYGSPSDTVIHGINADATNCWCRFQDFDTYSDTSVTSSLHAATGGGIGSELPHDSGSGGGSVNANSSSWASFLRVDATSSYYAASDVEQIGGSIGGYDSCNGGSHIDQDATKIWGAAGQISSRVTIDGTIYHDIHHTCGAEHIDMMQIGGGDGDVIKNVRGYQLPDQGIFARPYSVSSPLLSNLTIDNNMVGAFTSDDVNGSGFTSIGICNSGDNCSNTIDAENNTVTGSLDISPGGRNIVNNYATGGFTSATTGSVLMANNAYKTINPPGGTNVKHCTPTFTNSEATADATANYHLSSSDTCLKNQGNASTFATPDIDGDVRPQGSAPDIGADEFQEPTGNALRFSGTTGQQATYPCVNLSATAFTIVVMGHMLGDNTSDAMFTEETSGRSVRFAVERLGPPGIWNQSNVLNAYRHTTNDDFVWTTALTLTQSTGDFALFIDKVNGGGVPLNVHLYQWSGSAWVDATGSPTTTNFQLANGADPGAGCLSVIGNFGLSGDELHADVDLEAVYTRQLSDSTDDTIMSTHTTAAMLAQTPSWLVDFKDGLNIDLTGNSRSRVTLTSAASSTPFTASQWVPGS